MIDKGKAIGKLQMLKGDSKGLVASVFDVCIQGIKEMPEDATTGYCVKSKTADEMFRELGYEKVPCKYALSGCAIAYYEKNDGDHRYNIEFISGLDRDVGIVGRMDGRACALTKQELLACAQLLREMEAK